MRSVVRGPAKALIFVIELYRHMISPLRLPTCRFTPTCSQYAVEALTEYGMLRGGRLAVIRLAKCGPWHQGGWDPIPERQGVSPDDVPTHTDSAEEIWGCPAPRGESESRV
jgi:putative membrane protein insertion efficiency factor